MELKTLKDETLMSIRQIEMEGSDIVIEGRIMGALPVRTKLTPSEARKAFKLLSIRKILFLLTFLFRRG